MLTLYARIVRNELPARFLVARSVRVHIPPNASERKLWRLHSEKIKVLRNKLKEIEDLSVSSLDAYETSLIDLKLELSRRMLRSCELCERLCRVNRYERIGFCEVAKDSHLSGDFLHMGEERILVPSHTFFFVGCNFYCVYCQNWEIARQREKGFAIEGKKLARIAKEKSFISKNINLVGGEPTPHLHTIIEMIRHLEANKPIVWNSNMYMSRKTMRLLEGLVDVYLGDFKYGNNKCAWRLSKVKRYWEVVTRNFRLASKHAEIIVRHLVLPKHLECCSKRVLRWIGKNLPSASVNVMSQYRPCFEAMEYEVDRHLTWDEFSKAMEIAAKEGLNLVRD